VRSLGKAFEECTTSVEQTVQRGISTLKNAPEYWTGQVKNAPVYWSDEIKKAPSFCWGQISAAPKYWTEQVATLATHCLMAANKAAGVDVSVLQHTIEDLQTRNIQLTERASLLSLDYKNILEQNSRIASLFQNEHEIAQAASKRGDLVSQENIHIKGCVEQLQKELQQLRGEISEQKKTVAQLQSEKAALTALASEKDRIAKEAQNSHMAVQELSTKLEALTAENESLKKQVAIVSQKKSHHHAKDDLGKKPDEGHHTAAPSSDS
jgi:hypothetical protein